MRATGVLVPAVPTAGRASVKPETRDTVVSGADPDDLCLLPREAPAPLEQDRRMWSVGNGILPREVHVRGGR